MDPVRLMFHNPATERQYEMFRLSRFLRSSDNAFLCMTFVVECSVFLFCGYTDECKSVGLAAGVHGLFTAWEMWKRKRLSLDELLRVRTFFICARRATQLALFLSFITPDRTVDPLLPLTLWLRNGLILSVLQSTCARLKFSHHLPFQSLCTFVLLMLATTGPCETAGRSPLSSSFAVFAGWMNGFSDLAASVMNVPVGSVTPPPQSACLQLVLWLHVFGGLILVSFILWMQERASRVSFVRSLPEDRQQQEGLDSVVDISEFTFQLYFVLLTALVGVGWKVNVLFVRLFEASGF